MGSYGDHPYSYEVRSIRQLQSFCEQLLERIEKLEYRLQMHLDMLYQEHENHKKRFVKLEGK
jgi:hypothetical protein